jgi:Low molecular weight phosphotyrosine protein phosphatase
MNTLASVSPRTYNVLFLCTGNSARSILAESIMNRWGKGQFKGLSAGSHPKGNVHPLAVEILQQLDFPTDGLRSKSWNEFAAPGSPHLMETRIKLFLSLPIASIDKMRLQERMNAIGKTPAAASSQ